MKGICVICQQGLDEQYQQARIKLMGKAKKLADKKVAALGKTSEQRPSAGKNGGTYEHDFWSEFFHDAMEDLWKEKKGKTGRS